MKSFAVRFNNTIHLIRKVLGRSQPTDAFITKRTLTSNNIFHILDTEIAVDSSLGRVLYLDLPMVLLIMDDGYAKACELDGRTTKYTLADFTVEMYARLTMSDSTKDLIVNLLANPLFESELKRLSHTPHISDVFHMEISVKLNQLRKSGAKLLIAEQYLTPEKK